MTDAGREQLWIAHADGSEWTCELLKPIQDPTLFVEIRRDRLLIFGRPFTTRAAAEQWARDERTHLALD